MPTSRPLVLNYMCTQIMNRKPKTFLDIGVGFGKCGFLAREYLEVWNGPKGCWRRENWKYIVDGIEAYEEYITDLQKYFYSNIYIGDATRIIDQLGHYDFGVCTAMLEHVKKDEGFKFLTKVRKKIKYCIFTVPIDIGKQGAVYGNEYERHISEWSIEELSKFGKVRVLGNAQYMLEML